MIIITIVIMIKTAVEKCLITVRGITVTIFLIIIERAIVVAIATEIAIVIVIIEIIMMRIFIIRAVMKAMVLTMVIAIVKLTVKVILTITIVVRVRIMVMVIVIIIVIMIVIVIVKVIIPQTVRFGVLSGKKGTRRAGWVATQRALGPDAESAGPDAESSGGPTQISTWLQLRVEDSTSNALPRISESSDADRKTPMLVELCAETEASQKITTQPSHPCSSSLKYSSAFWRLRVSMANYTLTDLLPFSAGAILVNYIYICILSY